MTATILVVDDEPDLEALVLQKFRRQIREGTVAFVFAHDGLEALASIEQNPHVDMVVSDINMPRMDGLSLLAKLQEAEDKKSTIIVSAYGDMSNIRTAMNRGTFDFLTPFSVLCGLGVVTGYALLGACWLVMKTEGAVAERAREHAKLLLFGVLGFMAIVSLWTPLAFPPIRERWFSLPNIFWFAPVPLLVIAVTFALRRSLRRNGPDAVPFVLTLALVFLGYTGLGISVWPNVIPPATTLWDAAGPPQSLGFALVGALFIIPLILMYTAWSYYVFRGKVKPGEGYH
jgi:cytochrome bd-type quinol oxidase subunit 2